jgi:hypothetical protein
MIIIPSIALPPQDRRGERVLGIWGIIDAMTIKGRWPAGLIALAFGSSLAGCGGTLPDVAPGPLAAPPNYRQLTATYFAGNLTKIPAAGASISALQPAVAPQPAEWFSCVKLASGEYYAVFYADGKVADARSALPIDRCASADGYVPLPPPEKPKPAKPDKPDKAAKSKKGDAKGDTN